MPQLTDLPPEILTMIVTMADTLHDYETGYQIFDIMRVSQKLCDAAIRTHLKVNEFNRQEMITKMFRHKRCYVNHAEQVRFHEEVECDYSCSIDGPVELMERCPKGHMQIVSKSDVPYRRDSIDCCIEMGGGPAAQAFATAWENMFNM